MQFEAFLIHSIQQAGQPRISGNFGVMAGANHISETSSKSRWRFQGVSRVSREALFWTAALILLAWAPFGESLALCPLDRLGVSWCPGCGIGQAIGHALHGHWQASWQAHPLGVPVLLILLHRIIRLWGLFPFLRPFPSTLSS